MTDSKYDSVAILSWYFPPLVIAQRFLLLSSLPQSHVLDDLFFFFVCWLCNLPMAVSGKHVPCILVMVTPFSILVRCHSFCNNQWGIKIIHRQRLIIVKYTSLYTLLCGVLEGTARLSAQLCMEVQPSVRASYFKFVFSNTKNITWKTWYNYNDDRQECVSINSLIVLIKPSSFGTPLPEIQLVIHL